MDEPDRHALQAEAQDQGLSEAPHDDDLMHPLKKRKGSRPLPYQDTDYSAQEDVVEVRSSGGRDDLHERVHWQPQDDSPRHHHHQYREHAPQHRQPGGESSTYQPRYSDYAIRQARPGSQTSLDDGLDVRQSRAHYSSKAAGQGHAQEAEEAHQQQPPCTSEAGVSDEQEDSVNPFANLPPWTYPGLPRPDAVAKQSALGSRSGSGQPGGDSLLEGNALSNSLRNLSSGQPSFSRYQPKVDTSPPSNPTPNASSGRLQHAGSASAFQPPPLSSAAAAAKPPRFNNRHLDPGLAQTTTTGRRSAPASAGGGEYRSTGGAAGGNDYRSAGMRPPMRKDPDARLPSKAGGPSPAEDDPRYQMRQLIIALTKLRGPNSLGQDAVQAALEHSRALLVKAPEAASAPGKPGPAQTGSAGNPSSRDAYCGITEGFLDVLTSVGSLQNAAAGFKTSVANMGATPQLNATAGANDAEGIAMVDRLSSSIKQAKRALLCLETVEVVVANAFTDAVSQLDVVRQQHKAMHDTWEATVRIESISQQRKSYLKSMLRLPADEVGEDLLELFEKLRVNIAGGMDASAQRQQAAADARAMRSRLLLAAYPGLGSATYASSADGDLDTVVEREILRLYTLLRVMQNLYKFAADTAKSLQDTFHNSWWQVPILAGGQVKLMGTMSSLQASTSSLRTSGVVLHPDFRLPSTLSSRLAAQYFIKGFSNLSDAVKTRVKEAGASLSRRQALVGSDARLLLATATTRASMQAVCQNQPAGGPSMHSAQRPQQLLTHSSARPYVRDRIPSQQPHSTHSALYAPGGLSQSVPVMSSRDRGGYSSQHSPQDQRIPPLRNQLGPRDHYQPGTYPRSQPVQRPPPAAPAEPGPAAMPSLPEARATPPKERRKHGSSARERPEVSSGRAEQERSRLPRSHRDPGGFDGEEGQDPKAADDGDASVGVAGTQSSRDTSLTTEELSNESQPGGKQAHRSAPPQERAEGDVDLELDQSEGKRYEAAAQETSQEWPAASEAQPNASSAAMSAPSPQQAVALSQIHALASALAAHQQGSSAAQHSEAQHSAAQYSPDIMQLVAGLANEPNQHMNAYMQQLRLTMQMAQYQNMLAGQAQSSAPPSQAPAEPASSMQQD